MFNFVTLDHFQYRLHNEVLNLHFSHKRFFFYLQIWKVVSRKVVKAGQLNQ